jgi:hypothetical protein
MYKFPEAADQDRWVEEKIIKSDCGYKSSGCGRASGAVGLKLSQREW